MSADEPPRALRVSITDEIGRPLRKPGLARWLRLVAPARARGDVSLALVGDAAMRRLHRRFAGADRVTDVLSFPPAAAPVAARSRGGAVLGDIAISTGAAARQAEAAGHSLETELRVLALHGLLHLLGYDHATDNGTMARVERRLRRKGGLQEGLIDRAGQPRRPGAGARGRERRRGRA